MSEFLQASFIATGLTTLLGVVLIDDFCLKNGTIRGTGQKRVTNKKKWEQLKTEWNEGEILEAIALRFFQNIAVLPFLFLLYQTNNKVIVDVSTYLVALLLCYLVVNAESVLRMWIGVILYTILLLIGKEITYDLNVAGLVMAIMVLYAISLYWLVLADDQEGRWRHIIRSFLTFEIRELVMVMLVYLTLHMFDSLPIWKLGIGGKVLVILTLVQLPIPIYKVWNKVLK